MDDNSKSLATNACRDLITFLSLAENESSAAKAYQDCCKLGLPIMVCHLDRDATVVAGKSVFHFELQKTLFRYLAALRAAEVVGSPLKFVGL